jgi:predicted metal-binding protein
MTKPIRRIPTKHEEVILVCRKCLKKIGGGFGPDGDMRLDKAMRRELRLGKGRKSRIRFLRVPCFDICAKNAVTVVKGSEPGSFYLIPRGTALADVAATLGIGSKKKRG